jgi:type II secretory pathway component GspD/PulD (secretin)
MEDDAPARQVPLLGNIPVIGTFFGRRQNTKTRDELVLLICPHVVDPKDGGAAVSRDVLDANDVQALQSFTTENEVNDRLQKHLPPPRATPRPARV